ncbi:MAG: hypothetical protein KA375_03640 [Vitreoscilla sp.]|nr:hypothetical protein [Burkholderiales bacterium]MBP6336664.1 hypothetical protein [Vitreoscilla sp.]MBP6675382.1 hypothetical protein [Vitreoscilla sp.]
MNLKRLAVRSVVLMSLAATLGGCCFVPFERGRHGGYRSYSESGPNHQEMARGRH